MRQSDVLDLLDLAAELQLTMFIAGGWGVDALVGHQSREHNDLDVSLPAADAERLESVLAERDFELVVDWSPGRRAWRHADGREVDVHPLQHDGDGTHRLVTHDGRTFEMPPGSYVEGQIAGRQVTCLSVDKQLEYHGGYAPTEKDRHDIALLQQLTGDN